LIRTSRQLVALGGPTNAKYALYTAMRPAWHSMERRVQDEIAGHAVVCKVYRIRT
jgi:hypothetical protein